MSVLVLDKRKQPRMPCTEKRARLLLGRGRALVMRAYPFAIRLKDRAGGVTQPVRIKIDAGSKTTGRDRYKRTRLTKHGFPRGYRMRQKQVRGFQIGDRVCAVVPTGTKTGTWLGRVVVRKTGSVNIQTPGGAIQGISYRHCTSIQRADGYSYHIQPNQPKEEGGRKNESR
jgi:hypothetical protein